MSQRTEIKLEFLGISGINNFIASMSSPRGSMDASHFSGSHALITPDENLIKSGIEYELGKTINHPVSQEDCVVKAIIPRYKVPGRTPPEITLIVQYEKNDKIVIDIIHVAAQNSTHGYFGYTQEYTPELLNLQYGDPLPKGTVLAAAASYGEEGTYRYGLNANVVFMSHPSCSDDGYVISESFAKRAGYLSMSKRVINITKNTIPVNVNGDENHFKFIPDLGEYVRPDGLLCATRERNDWFSISDMNTRNLCEVDMSFDTLHYVNPGSFVMDVKVVRGNYLKSEFSSRMTEQLDAQAEMYINYCRAVQQQYEKIISNLKAVFSSTDHVITTGECHRHVTDCIILVRHADSGKSRLMYRKLPIDQYRVEVTVGTVMIPGLGAKLTDRMAAKGVVCAVLPDDQMPVDEHGNIADIISDPNSTVSRMNVGRSYEHYLGAVSRDNWQRLRSRWINQYGPHFTQLLEDSDVESVRGMFQKLGGMLNSESLGYFTEATTEELRHYIGKCERLKGLEMFYPPDNERNIVDVINDIQASEFAPHFGKVTYVNGQGQRVTTVENVLMGVMYYMFLEKVANTYSAVSSSKVNNFGFPVKSTTTDKYRYPHSLTPTKITGETENRILNSFMDPEGPADIQDLSMNPNSHKLLYKHALESHSAFDTNFNIDREDNPYSQTKSLQLMHHVTIAAGFDFEHVEDHS